MCLGYVLNEPVEVRIIALTGHDSLKATRRQPIIDLLLFSLVQKFREYPTYGIGIIYEVRECLALDEISAKQNYKKSEEYYE